MTEKEELLDIGRRIQLYRKRKGMTQEELSEQIGIGKNHLSNIENGKKEMGISTFCRIVSVLGISADELLQRSTVYDVNNKYSSDIQMMLLDCDDEIQRHISRVVRYEIDFFKKVKK